MRIAFLHRYLRGFYPFALGIELPANIFQLQAITAADFEHGIDVFLKGTELATDKVNVRPELEVSDALEMAPVAQIPSIAFAFGKDTILTHEHLHSMWFGLDRLL